MIISPGKTFKIKRIEWIIYPLIWLGLFTIPFFQYRKDFVPEWQKVVLEWIRISSFFLIFIINELVLVPRFLFRKKYWFYLVGSLSVLILISVMCIALQYTLTPHDPIGMPKMELGPGMPPMELGSKMPAPIGYKIPEPVEEKSLFMTFIDNLIIALLIMVAGTTIKLLTQWLTEEGKRKDIEKEQLKTELALLRHQVSPHFFMNTLNNIHALIDINTENAKDAVIRLSTLMRYLLYETTQGQTSVKKEIAFIESYIALMQLRFSKKVTITLEVPSQLPDLQIPPMLFISFIENAFKHGVSYQQNSFVHFSLSIHDGRIDCIVKNSKHLKPEKADKKYSGIGMTNIRKSLDLLFTNNYILDVRDTEKEFEVQLSIPITENKAEKKRTNTL